MRAKRKHHTRTAAQKAATRKLVAMNRARRSGSHASRARHSNPIAANPVRRRRHHTRSVAHHTRHVSRRRRHNPIGGNLAGIGAMLSSAAIGAGGMIVTDLVAQKVQGFLPASMVTGQMAHVTRAGIAILLGVGVHKFASAKMARDFTTGALTVIAHDVAMTTLGGALGVAAPAASATPVAGLGYMPREENLGYLPVEGLGGDGFGYQQARRSMFAANMSR